MKIQAPPPPLIIIAMESSETMASITSHNKSSNSFVSFSIVLTLRRTPSRFHSHFQHRFPAVCSLLFSPFPPFCRFFFTLLLAVASAAAAAAAAAAASPTAAFVLFVRDICMWDRTLLALFPQKNTSRNTVCAVRQCKQAGCPRSHRLYFLSVSENALRRGAATVCIAPDITTC